MKSVYKNRNKTTRKYEEKESLAKEREKTEHNIELKLNL